MTKNRGPCYRDPATYIPFLRGMPQGARPRALLYNWHAPICESQKPFWLKCICRISVMPVAKHQCFEDPDTS